MRVHYIADDGVVQIKEVPKDDSRTNKWGILVGPPDLSELPLPKKKIKEITNALAYAGFADYKDTQGRRNEILEIVKQATGKLDKSLLRQILYIYQNEFLEARE